VPNAAGVGDPDEAIPGWHGIRVANGSLCFAFSVAAYNPAIPPMQFAPDEKIRQIPELVAELFQHVTTDQQTFFVSDEATIWDVSMMDPEELLQRCEQHYGVPVSREDLKLPLWELLPMLDQRRIQARR
jgi:hypothetical protein